MVCHHARDATIRSPNRFIAELKCVIWTLQSNRDLGVEHVILASDYREVIEAINNPLHWPRYRSLLQQVTLLRTGFSNVMFVVEGMGNNSIARDIAKKCIAGWSLSVIFGVWRAGVAT
ncbi:hypothetical protein F2Q70_00015377 [Brassica cretica]|nr:hypothetical protein F2Q70_00015377 [Brassica cretica]KAF3535686.1 hypothetical protein F2Q69_00019993 [Brassica cretica]